MTIAFGLHCKEGVILAADSEISGYLAKWQEPKFAQMFWTNEIGMAAVYAGSVDYAQMACQKLRTAILDCKRLKERLLKFTRARLAPIPVRRSRLSLS